MNEKGTDNPRWGDRYGSRRLTMSQAIELRRQLKDIDERLRQLRRAEREVR